MTPRLLPFLLLPVLGCGALPGSPDGGADAGPPFSDGGLDLNDVSFLFPLPPGGQFGQLLSMTSSGPRGELLPRAHFDQLPRLLEGVPTGGVYSALRVVSARVDPCFPGTAPPAPPTCVRQLRLVAQPVVVGADAGFLVTTDDATVHLFYELGPADFAALHAELLALKSTAGAETAGRPLNIHPVMQRQGLTGAYASTVKGLITQHCGEANLTRVASMGLAGAGSIWDFRGFNRDGGALDVDTIPRISGTAQQFQETGNTAFRTGGIIPQVQDDELWVLLSEREMRLSDEGTLQRALGDSLRVEHPERHSPRTADCVSCHVASRARRNAETYRKVDTSGHADAFRGNPRFDLRRLDGAGDDPRALRAFGYFGSQSAFIQRTINESAVVAEALSRAP